jgi:penicillin-binding protein 1C
VNRWRIFRFGLLLGGMLILAPVLLLILFPYPPAALQPPGGSLRFLAADGTVLRATGPIAAVKDSFTSLKRIPPLFLSMTLIAEDRRFFHHPGVDPCAVVRAAWQNMRAGRIVSGASTLTMQTVRMIAPQRRTFAAKLGETIGALRLERTLSKDEILLQYVNRAYYGNGAYGVRAAAERYFGQPIESLSAAQATLLAVLPRAPLAYDPLRSLPAALARRSYLLGLLEKNGVLSHAERLTIEQCPLGLRTERKRETKPFLAPHFVDYVASRLPEPARAGGMLYTTLDSALQEQLEALVRAHVTALSAAGVKQAGVLVLDSHSGALRAMVGAPDYFDRDQAGQVNITVTPRHPGSALKPFTYALALEQGDTPASIAWDVLDVPSAYRPANADGRQHGPVRYRSALASSYNLAAVHVAERIGTGRLLARLREAGLTTLGQPADAYGPALTLGSGATRLIELAAAYTFLVNGGEKVSPWFFERYVPPSGAPVLFPPPPRHRVFSPEVSWLVMDMLSDPSARRAAFGEEIPFDMPFPVVAKTGTSGGFADNVALVTTREFTIAAWAGNFDGKPMHGVLAMVGAAPLARRALMIAAGHRSWSLPQRPDGIVEHSVCVLSGEAPGPQCPVHKEFFIRGTEPHTPCTWHKQRGDRLAVDWPASAAPWATRLHKAGGQSRSHALSAGGPGEHGSQR